MVWIFLLVAGLAAALVKLGMYSVWVSVLGGACKFAGLVFVLVSIVCLWRKFFLRNGAQRNLP